MLKILLGYVLIYLYMRCFKWGGFRQNRKEGPSRENGIIVRYRYSIEYVEKNNYIIRGG